MKTFNEWLISEIRIKQNVREEDYESDEFTHILMYATLENVIKFALYVAKDCLKQKISDSARIASQQCIDLVEQWLKDQSPTIEQLATVANAADFSNFYSDEIGAYVASCASNCTWATVNVIRAKESNNSESRTREAISDAHIAAQDAIRAFPENKKSKSQQYLSYARMFAHEKENPIQGTPEFTTQSQIIDILQFFDQLADYKQSLGQFNPKTFIYNPETFELNLPKGYRIKGDSAEDLANKILKDDFALDYLNYLYHEEKFSK